MKALVHRHPGRFLGGRAADIRLGGKTCMRGTGISTEVVYARWLAGENEATIATDAGMPYEHVIAAIHFELGRQWRSKNSIEALKP